MNKIIATVMSLMVAGSVYAQDAAPQRGKVDVVFCVDRSGSMEASFKLKQAKAAALAAAQSLTKEDRIAIITFADTAEVLLAPTAARDDQTVAAAVQSLQSGGHTAMYQALELSHALMAEQQRETGNVLLAKPQTLENIHVQIDVAGIGLLGFDRDHVDSL